MTPSRYGAVTDALLTKASATSIATVFDGPPLTADAPVEYLIVGGTDNPDDDAADLVWSPAPMGNRWVEETGSVACAVLVGTGDDTVKTARDRAMTVVAELATAIQADPYLGGVLAEGYPAQLSAGRASQRRNTNGLVVAVVLTVTFTALLT